MSSSKKQTVGYMYKMVQQMVLWRGPIDYITEISFDEKTAFRGKINGQTFGSYAQGGDFFISAPGLFGGEDREGGVAGPVRLCVGHPTQSRQNIMQAILGEAIPGLRGLVTLIFGRVEQPFYFGNSPYLKNVSVRGTRIHTRDADGREQWYPTKAEIRPDLQAIIDGPWQYHVLPYHSNPGYVQLTPPSSWQGESTMPLNSGKIWLYPTPPGWPTPQLSVVWVRKTVNAPAGLVIQLRADNGCLLWVNGEYIGASNRENADIPSNDRFPVEFVVPESGTYEILGKAFSESLESAQGGNVLDVTLDSSVEHGGDMNPAHIIREVYTSPDCGLGLSDADIDDANFREVADTLFNEKMGLSFEWSPGKMPPRDFLEEICSHIDASTFIGQNGKAKIKLIRADYNYDTLPVIDSSVIISIDNVSSTPALELVNTVIGIYTDPKTNNPASVQVSDPALVQMTARKKPTTLNYPGFHNGDICARRLQSDLRALSSSLYSCQLVVQQLPDDDFNIGSAFILDHPDLQLYRPVMRVTDIDWGDGMSNQLRLSVTQDVYSLPDNVAIAPSPGWQNPARPPSASPNRLVIERPYWDLVQDREESAVNSLLAENPDAGFLGVAAERPSGNAINAEIYVNAGAGYEEAGYLDFSGAFDLSSLDRISTTATISNVVGDVIGKIAQLDDELIVVTAVDGSGIATIDRGVLDTMPVNHGASRAMCWQDFLSSSPTEYMASEQLNVRVLPGTFSGQLPLDSAPTDSVVMNSRAVRPYLPRNIKINGEYWPQEVEDAAINVSWDYANRLQETGASVLSWFSAGTSEPEPGATTTIRFYAVGDFTPTHTITGVTGKTASWTPGNGDWRIEVLAERDGYESAAIYSHTVKLGEQLWTPAFLLSDLDFWYDDQSEITVDSNSRISQWNDRSSKGWHLTQATTSRRPVVEESSENSRRAIVFDGSVFMDFPSAARELFRNVSTGWLMSVSRPGVADASATERPIVAFGTNGNSVRLGLFAGLSSGTPSRNIAGGRRLDANSFQSVGSSKSNAQQLGLVLGIFDLQNALISLYENGTLESSGTFQTAGSTSDTVSQSARVGSNVVPTPNTFFRGKQVAILGGIGLPSEADRQRLEGWAAWRYGNVDALPIDHPYKTAPPYVSGGGTWTREEANAYISALPGFVPGATAWANGGRVERDLPTWTTLYKSTGGVTPLDVVYDSHPVLPNTQDYTYKQLSGSNLSSQPLVSVTSPGAGYAFLFRLGGDYYYQYNPTPNADWGADRKCIRTDAAASSLTTVFQPTESDGYAYSYGRVVRFPEYPGKLFEVTGGQMPSAVNPSPAPAGRPFRLQVIDEVTLARTTHAMPRWDGATGRSIALHYADPTIGYFFRVSDPSGIWTITDLWHTNNFVDWTMVPRSAVGDANTTMIGFAGYVWCGSHRTANGKVWELVPALSFNASRIGDARVIRADANVLIAYRPAQVSSSTDFATEVAWMYTTDGVTWQDLIKPSLPVPPDNAPRFPSAPALFPHLGGIVSAGNGAWVVMYKRNLPGSAPGNDGLAMYYTDSITSPNWVPVT